MQKGMEDNVVSNNNVISNNIEIYSQVFTLLGKCMDDYLFIYDILNDKYIISEGAVETFLLDDIETTPGSELFERVVYPEDYPLLQEDMEQITSGKSREHNLEYRWLGRNQKPVWISCRGQVVTDKQGRAVYLLGRIKEIAKRSKIDEVTGLYRVHSLKEALEQCRDKEHFCGYLLQIGIDNFKEINERYGQAFGDVVLSDTAQCIRAVVKDNGRVFRMDGDEMIVLVTDCDTSQENTAKEMYKEIRHRVDRHISDGGHHMFYTISAGYVYFDETAVDVDKLVEQAGFALHQAKLDGKNMSVCYTQEVYDAYVHTLDVQEELREDIENDFRGFELYYQPVVNIPKKKILGAEALIRWNSTKFGFMSPGQFIPMLEESGLIIPLGRWIAKTALEQCVKWQELVPGFRINVNLSFVQIKKSDALQDMLNLIRDLDIDKNMVMFEITESGELETGVASQVLRAFKDESIHLAIDDFGTGYSNLRYVKNMTFDLVKIDQSFIRNIRESQYDYLVVKQFTELAHSLNLTVCYEGVETKEDFECVLELNPDYIQGYYFSKPIPAGEFEEKCLNKPLDF